MSGSPLRLSSILSSGSSNLILTRLATCAIAAAGSCSSTALSSLASHYDDDSNDGINSCDDTTMRIHCDDDEMGLLPPRARAGIWMAIAMALHFGGYEFARSSNLTLFTSPTTGFSQAFAFPLAMAAVSPFSFLLLMGYNQVLQADGPRMALRQSTMGSIAAIGLSAIIFRILSKLSMPGVLKGIVGLSFVFQNSYAHLLYSQQWSFLGSISSVEQGARWFASIAGLSSLASMCTGTLVGPLAKRIGLYGLLSCTVITLTLSLLCAERAYHLSDTFGFDPGLESKAQKAKKATPEQKAGGKQSLVAKAQALFTRVPTLKALFFEVLSFQCMSTILNVCLVGTLKTTIPNDVDRAAWTGRFYASINAVSALFQFVLLPLGMNKIPPRIAWRIMPIIPVAACVGTALQSNPSLGLLAIAFFSAKFLDYSLRGVVTEMVYVPLDFESRYVGKELNGVFGNRLGKSGMSVLLSALTGVQAFGIMQMTQMATVFGLSWAGCTFWLSALVSKEKSTASTEKRDD